MRHFKECIASECAARISDSSAVLTYNAAVNACHSGKTSDRHYAIDLNTHVQAQQKLSEEYHSWALGKNRVPSSAILSPSLPTCGPTHNSLPSQQVHSAFEVSPYVDLLPVQPSNGFFQLPNDVDDNDMIVLDDNIGDICCGNSFPSPEQCQEATVHTVPGDGNCLFHSLVAAATSKGIIMEPNFSAASLRNNLMLFLQENRHNSILPVCFGGSYVSPDEHLRSQMPGRLVQTCSRNNEQTLTPCTSCLEDKDNTSKRHRCNGVPFADIRILGKGPTIYTSFETYIDGMSQNGAYGEDLEIMAFSACYEVNIGVCHFASEWFDAGGQWLIHTFAHPRSKGTIMLINANGRGHYDWISFPKTITTRARAPAPAPATATATAPAPGSDKVIGTTPLSFSNYQFPTLFDSQIQSLEAIENADKIATEEQRLATVAIVTPTSSGKDLLSLLWAVKKRGVSIVFVPYVHLYDAAIKYAEQFNCTVEKYGDTKRSNNSAATCVVCPYESADQVVLLAQTLASQGRLAGIFLNECQVLDIRLEFSFRNFEGHHAFFAKLTNANIFVPVVFLTATLMDPEAVLNACGLPTLFDEAYYISPMRTNLDFKVVFCPDGINEMASLRMIMQNSVAAIKHHAPKHRALVFVMYKWELDPVANWLRRSFPGVHVVAL
jgi:hypothetical protein